MSVRDIILAVLTLCRRYPVRLVGLALPVILVYDAVVLVGIGRPLGQGHGSVALYSPYDALGLSILAPVISSLFVHAIVSLGGERRSLPLGRVARAGVRTLPAVLLVESVANFGIIIGFLFFFVPGVVLLLRWSVVAQVVARERVGLRDALRLSGDLVSGHYLHVFLLMLVVTALSAVVAAVGGGVMSIAAGSVIGTATLELVFETVIASFGALALAVLYFDLHARQSVLTNRAGTLEDGAGSAA